MRVAVIDDEEVIRDVLVEMFLERNFEAIAYVDGTEILSDINPENQPDFIIIDLGLPKMSGLDCYNELIKMGISSKVIFSSGKAPSKEIKELVKKNKASFI